MPIPRYLACSLETKSEIVVPIRVRGEIVGELDIDSHTPAAFKADDRQLVEHCARLVGSTWRRRHDEPASAMAARSPYHDQASGGRADGARR